MNNDFQTLVEFLGRCGPEVTGHGGPQPGSVEAEKLSRFAAGQSDKDERAEICSMLRLHPAWLRWLAERVKMARTTRLQGVSA